MPSELPPRSGSLKLRQCAFPAAIDKLPAHQKAYVEAIGKECARLDIPYVFELPVYPFPKSASHTTDDVGSPETSHATDDVGSPEKMRDSALDSVREFAQPRYGIDLFTLESPLPGAALPARDGSPVHLKAPTLFDEMGKICKTAGIPWVASALLFFAVADVVLMSAGGLGVSQPP